MSYEVVVVGGGIGGLTVAALLAARGVSVCLYERQSRPGGCVVSFEQAGYSFEPTAGLYSGWEPGGIYAQVFSKLPVKPPEVRRLSPAYNVRLPDQKEVAVSEDIEEFEAELRRAFPECYQAAVDFYRHAVQVIAAPSSVSAEDPTSGHLSACSERFQRFIDVQLQMFIQSMSDQCSFPEAAFVLTAPRRGLWAIRGGAQSLANRLAESLKQSGGRLRLDTPVLRLAYGSDGAVIGVDLLSGERIMATRAIVSNLTVWDTYGKLIGLSRTPPDVAKQLKQLRAWGSYSAFLGMDQTRSSDLPKNTTLVLTDWQHAREYEPDQSQLAFAPAPTWDSRGPAGKRAVTVSTFTYAEDWFSFHEDETSHEQQDQAALESLWSRLHLAMPELGDRVEVIETSTPQTLYETTRRKFGMTGKVITGKISPPTPTAALQPPSCSTIFPNVFLIGDTVSPGWGLEGICTSALALAQTLI
jgi:phytoene dehydrogenase-like protein